MAAAAKLVGVGPMAAVAGAMAQGNNRPQDRYDRFGRQACFLA
jgi:hypothetical protein